MSLVTFSVLNISFFHPSGINPQVFNTIEFDFYILSARQAGCPLRSRGDCWASTMLATWRRLSSTRPPFHLLPQLLQSTDDIHHVLDTKGAPYNYSYDQITSFKDHSRCLFSLPGFDDQIAKKYNERKLLGYSPQQLYDVVADVDNYSFFVPWCQRSTVLRRDGNHYLEAELQVGFQVFIEK